jgi:hypothetical protein
VLVKTTSLATVAAPKFIDGKWCCQSTLPVAASTAVRPPAAGLEAHTPGEASQRAACACADSPVEPGDEEPFVGERHRRLDPAQVTREDGDELARQRPGVVLMLADRDRPELLAVVGAVGVCLAHLAGDQHHLGLDPLDGEGGDDRGDHQVVVAYVVWEGLPEPEQLAGLAVEGDERIGVEVGAGTTGAVWELGRSVERPRVGDREEDPSLAVDGGRIPESAAAVDRRVAPQLGAVGDRVERPLRFAGRGVERPDDPERSALVEGSEAVARARC